MSVYSLVVGDLEPDMEIDLTNQLSLLTGALALNLEWFKPDGLGGFLAPVTVPLVAIDQPNGKLKRVWVSGDSSIAGIHRGRVIVTTSNSELAHWPDDGSYLYWIVHV
jgi:hypothetical protein